MKVDWAFAGAQPQQVMLMFNIVKKDNRLNQKKGCYNEKSTNPISI
jgi:hypothetical protein